MQATNAHEGDLQIQKVQNSQGYGLKSVKINEHSLNQLGGSN